MPAGAIDSDTTIRIAQDSTGAPALPAGLAGAGSTYVITPHGGEFAQPVEVRIPAPTVTRQPNQEIRLAKAQPGEQWVVLGDSELKEGMLSAKVSSFSYFRVVTVTYPRSLVEAPPLQVTATSLSCGDHACDQAPRAVTATYTVTSNGGQLPADCSNGSLVIFAATSINLMTDDYRPIALSGGSLTEAIAPGHTNRYDFSAATRCLEYSRNMGQQFDRRIIWAPSPGYPNVALVSMPAQIDVVEGLTANLDVVLAGGASSPAFDVYTSPNPERRAIIDWQRSDDNGASWRVIARSYQDEANPLPDGIGVRWRYWSVRHGFIANAADQGALIRVHGCYTPSDRATPPCVTSAATRVNVLQQSALPAIVAAPRSVLVRTGQTASLSATAAGLPAPTLQWQTRPANSSDVWSDVSAGTGATTANYTTAPVTLADTGVQYRVVATNSSGSVESATATVSVSDQDVAPAITTQPGSLSVALGGDAVFAVAARGTEALSYQWRFNGAVIAGANSAVLRLTAVTAARAGSYSVTVSNDAGDADSNAAVLTVVAGIPAAVAPTIVTQPAAVTVNAGNTATFAVGVDGSGPFAFQWRRDGVAIAGAASAVITLNNASASDAGSYSVVVSNSVSPAGVPSSAATLTVAASSAASAPAIVTQPATLVAAPGGSSVLAVAATGSGPLSYQWSLNGTPILGATAPVLVLASVTASDVGSYTVTISNNLDSVTSQAADVILLGAPVIFGEPADVTVFENAITTFRVDAGGAAVHYQWLLNGSPIPNSDSTTYTTPSLTVANSGAVYSVIVFNGAGVALSQSAVLTVLQPAPPTILQQPADVSVQAGLPANLCMAFGGTPPFSVQMNRWSGAEWTPIGSNVAINDNGVFCLSTPNLQLADNGAQFVFFASNAEGGLFETMTRTVTVTVTAPTVVTATTLASLSSSGVTANNRSSNPSLSADGRLVAFVSDGTNLVPGFTNPNGGHAYVRDLATGVTTSINQTPDGGQSMLGVIGLELAAGGRFAVFSSLAGDLVAGDTNGSQDVFLRDLQTGVTERLNVLPDGSQITGAGNGVSDMQLDISADGRFVSFVYNHDLFGANPPGLSVLYLRDTQRDQTRLVASSPTYGIALSALSSNGEHIVYAFAIPSPAPHLVTYYDAEADDTSTLFSLDTTNGQDYIAQGLSISDNGRYVAFAVRSPGLFGGSTVPQIVAIDRTAPNTLIFPSTGANGLGDGASSYPKLSGDGRYVLFATIAPNLTGNVANFNRSVLVVRDLQNQTTSVASRRPNGTDVWTAAVFNSHALSGDGAVLAVVANESDMTGGIPDHQVYVAPRP
ncbi:MAG: immunoglobulin domain-containing protein [Steroidobacter sp.]